MNELLQHHGCSNVFTIPEGLKELMADISREVLRDQPPKIFEYIANYLSVLLVTREHGILAVKILDDLCDCRASVSEHLIQIGMGQEEADMLSQIIKEEIEGFAPEEGKEKVKEAQILKKVLARSTLDEEMAARVCQVARNAYRDYWYRKKLMEKHMQVRPNEPWEKAAQRTLEIYKTTKPSYSELTRATQKIQAAYRGYYVRRNLQQMGRSKKSRPKVEIPGPPLDVAGSREIDLGPVINVQVREEDTTGEFGEVVGTSLNLKYDPMKTITHVTEEATPEDLKAKSEMATRKSVVEPQRAKSEMARRSVVPTKSVTGAPSQMRKSAMVDVAEDETALTEAPSEVPLTELENEDIIVVEEETKNNNDLELHRQNDLKKVKLESTFCNSGETYRGEACNASRMMDSLDNRMVNSTGCEYKIVAIVYRVLLHSESFNGSSEQWIGVRAYGPVGLNLYHNDTRLCSIVFHDHYDDTVSIEPVNMETTVFSVPDSIHGRFYTPVHIKVEPDAPLEKRRSHFSEPSIDPSRASSKMAPSLGSANKISFTDLEGKEQEGELKEPQAETPTTEEAPGEAPEEVPAEVTEVAEEAPKAEEAPPVEAVEVEIPEELPPQALATLEEVPEVPEEIAEAPVEQPPEVDDSAPEADDSTAATDSAPLPSAASSAPGTDVDTGGEEEGE